MDRGVDRLAAEVVGNAGVVDVDGDALDGDLGASAGLAQAHHQRGPLRRERGVELLQRLPEDAGQAHRAHHMALACPTVERVRDLPRRVDGLAAKGLEAGEQDGGGHGLGSRNQSRPMLKTRMVMAVGHCARITPFLSGNSSSAAGTMLKLAAIGVMSVPQ